MYRLEGALGYVVDLFKGLAEKIVIFRWSLDDLPSVSPTVTASSLLH